MNIERHLFHKLPKSDTCWDVCAANDGKVYVGACSEHTAGGIAELVQFDPPQKRIAYIASMSDVTGEEVGDTHAPQGKIHFSLCSSADGLLYGSTHCTTPPRGDTFWDPWAMHMDARRCFRGAHLYRYESHSNEILDFGIVVPFEGVSVMTIDESSQRLIAATFPRAHLHVWDLKGRNRRNLGRVSEHYVLSLLRYDDRNIYFSDYYGRLLSVDPSKPAVTKYDFQLPHRSSSDGMRNWMAHAVLAPDGWAYAGMYSYPNVIRFRPNKLAFEVEDLGPGWDIEEGDPAAGYAFTAGVPVGFVLSGTKLFYAQLVYLGPKDYVGSYLASYDIETGAKNYYGKLQDGDTSPLVWKGAAGVDGSLLWADFDLSPPSLWSVRVGEEAANKPVSAGGDTALS